MVTTCTVVLSPSICQPVEPRHQLDASAEANAVRQDTCTCSCSRSRLNGATGVSRRFFHSCTRHLRFHTMQRLTVADERRYRGFSLKCQRSAAVLGGDQHALLYTNSLYLSSRFLNQTARGKNQTRLSVPRSKARSLAVPWGARDRRSSHHMQKWSGVADVIEARKLVELDGVDPPHWGLGDGVGYISHSCSDGCRVVCCCGDGKLGVKPSDPVLL